MFRKALSVSVAVAFLFSIIMPLPSVHAGEVVMPVMPAPGTMVSLSSSYTPANLKGIAIHPDNALQFDFLIHRGDGNLDDAQKKEEYTKLVKYFLASLTITDKDQWVNLSPYEKNRIIGNNLGQTEMGRDLLSQDYLLKQLTSSLMYPESGLGQKFWNRVYDRANKEFGTSSVPVNTFNKVWIMPDQAVVYESGNAAYIIKSHLKVMLEEDYLSLKEHNGIIVGPSSNNTHSIGSQIVREIVLPEIEKEVNEGKNFAMLRQIFSAMVLATWYKKALKESLLGKIYADQAKINGVDQDPQSNEKIYQEYLKAFKKGVFNFIKEDVDKYTKQPISRKYFAGGIINGLDKTIAVHHVATPVEAVGIANEVPGDDAAMVSLTPMPSRRAVLGAGVRGIAVAAATAAAPFLQAQSENKASLIDEIKRNLPYMSIESIEARIKEVKLKGITLKPGDKLGQVKVNGRIFSNTIAINSKDGNLVLTSLPSGVVINESSITAAQIDWDQLIKTAVENRMGQQLEKLISREAMQKDIGFNGEGAKIFDWLMANDYFLEKNQLKVPPKPLTPEKITALQKQYPAYVDRIKANLANFERTMIFQDGWIQNLDKMKTIYGEDILNKLLPVLLKKVPIRTWVMAEDPSDRNKLKIGELNDNDILFFDGELFSNLLFSNENNFFNAHNDSRRVGVQQRQSLRFIYRYTEEPKTIETKDYREEGAGPFQNPSIQIKLNANIDATLRTGKRITLHPGDIILLSGKSKDLGVGLRASVIYIRGINTSNKKLMESQLGPNWYKMLTQLIDAQIMEQYETTVRFKSDIDLKDQTTMDKINKIVTDNGGDKAALKVLMDSRGRASFDLKLDELPDPIIKGLKLERTLRDDKTLQNIKGDRALFAKSAPGGIDLNSANLNLLIKRNGKGVPLPLAQQDMAQLSHLGGFIPEIKKIRPAEGLSEFSPLNRPI